MKKISKLCLEKIRSVSTSSWILIAIILIGIFLRTYQFRDWMTFNPDQARDALEVQKVLDGRAPLPVLGPQAGNTAFKLGPAFYYFEIISAKIFGREAHKMAYPDLFFSIISIPLLFVFLRNFFVKNVALTLTGLYTISFFVITYSRFAFNPNSIPFFTLLFLLSLLGILNAEKRENFWFAILLGISMGIGIQLHALLFLAMPFVSLLVLVYLFVKKIFVWKSVLITLAFFAIFNGPYIFGEMRTGWTNSKAFFAGAGSETESADGRLGRNLSNDLICHIQGASYITASLGGGDKCKLMNLPTRITKKGWGNNIGNVGAAALGSILFVGGVVLLIYYVRKEKDARKKNFLMLVGLYLFAIFLIFIPVSASISIRYYIAIVFVPFIFLGLFWKFVLEKFSKKTALILAIVVSVGLGIANLYSIAIAADQYRSGKASTVDTAVFGETEKMSLYIFDNAKENQKVYLAGKKQYLKRFFMPLEYFAKQKDIDLVKIEKKKPAPGGLVFYVAKKQSKKDNLPVLIEGHESIGVKNFGNISLTEIAN